MFVDFVEKSIDKSNSERLKAREDGAGPAHVFTLGEDTTRLEQKQRMLQVLSAELEGEKIQAEQRVAILEDKLTMEAEAEVRAAMQQETA